MATICLNLTMESTAHIKLQDTKAEPAASVLGDINQLFHQGYASRKQYFADKIRLGDILLIVRMDSRLIACCGNSISEFTVNGPHYHRLKALSHSTMAVYYTLMQTSEPDAAALLRDLLAQLKQQANNPAGQQLIAATTRLLGAVAFDGTIDHSLVLEYSRKLEPVFATLMLQSATDEATQLLLQLKKIASQYNKSTAETFFVVFGGPQARYRQLSTLVFKQWCRQATDQLIDTNHQVRYYEQGTSLDDAINLVATALADRELAQTFLGRADALEQDVLALVAEQAIKHSWQAPDNEE